MIKLWLQKAINNFDVKNRSKSSNFIVIASMVPKVKAEEQELKTRCRGQLFFIILIRFSNPNHSEDNKNDGKFYAKLANISFHALHKISWYFFYDLINKNM